MPLPLLICFVPALAVAASAVGGTSGPLPAAADLRPALQAWGLDARQQGARPTCSAFTVTGAIEFALAQRQGHATRLSVEFLNWAANRAGNDAHDGGFFSDLWNGFMEHGACAESEMPYLKILIWTNSEPGARLTLPFTVPTPGRYAARLTAMVGPGLGACDVELDGKPVVTATRFTAGVDDELDLALGTHELAAGPHELAFRSVADATGRVRPVAVEMLRLLRLPPEATRAVKTHHEAHFIRLGIGRAVYAYRLAHGELPDSLEALVKAGLLPERYQSDENNQSLEARREADWFVVESQGPSAWTHRWQGLDARR